MRRKTGRIKSTDGFSIAIRNYIETNKLSAHKISIFTGIHPSTISKIINNKILWAGEEYKLESLAKYITFKGKFIERLPEGVQSLASPSVNRKKVKTASSGG